MTPRSTQSPVREEPPSEEEEEPPPAPDGAVRKRSARSRATNVVPRIGSAWSAERFASKTWLSWSVRTRDDARPRLPGASARTFPFSRSERRTLCAYAVVPPDGLVLSTTILVGTPSPASCRAAESREARWASVTDAPFSTATFCPWRTSTTPAAHAAPGSPRRARASTTRRARRAITRRVALL
jgi:hypothetical protein